ncbi:MAG: hypothetical protein U0736_23130 [Gemmataceae bacterium]
MTPLPPLRAPAGDGELLAVPPLDTVGTLVEMNRYRLARPRQPVLELPWPELRARARRELLLAARAYLSAAGEPLPLRGTPGGDAPLLLAGHQPELFHPGVWVKNFALAGLARRHGWVAVNLLVDNDTVKSTAVFVPATTADGLGIRTMPFDRWPGETPWEEYRPVDASAFRQFGDEAAAAVREWGYEPLLTRFWPDVTARAAEGGPVGGCFAAARRRIEREWGCHNLELPLSVVCASEAFAWFAGGLLAELPRFVETYNRGVHEYRHTHHIRSRHHPVPDLAASGDWLEAPFWGWRTDTPRRARLFARLRPDRVELRAGDERWPDLPSPRRGPVFIEAWRRLEADGYKVRSRALTTTLFARLFLGDLFLHGIGGGKYDELTDELIRRFWRVEPPAFVVVSATHWLPLPTPPTTADDLHRVEHLQRDLQYNPDRHLTADERERLAAIVRQKRDWVARTPTTRTERRERFREIRRLSESLWPAVADRQAEARRHHERLANDLRHLAVAHRRDWAFPLYPEAQLRAAMTAVR